MKLDDLELASALHEKRKTTQEFLRIFGANPTVGGITFYFSGISSLELRELKSRYGIEEEDFTRAIVPNLRKLMQSRLADIEEKMRALGLEFETEET